MASPSPTGSHPPPATHSSSPPKWRIHIPAAIRLLASMDLFAGPGLRLYPLAVYGKQAAKLRQPLAQSVHQIIKHPLYQPHMPHQAL
jgi:hypothetical protein